MTLTGPGGETLIETESTILMFEAAQIPGGAGQTIEMSVATIGPAAVSRPVSATFIV